MRTWEFVRGTGGANAANAAVVAANTAASAAASANMAATAAETANTAALGPQCKGRRYFLSGLFHLE